MVFLVTPGMASEVTFTVLPDLQINPYFTDISGLSWTMEGSSGVFEHSDNSYNIDVSRPKYVEQ